MTRVAITGIGLITPGGNGLDRLWQSVRSGKSCIRAIDRFDAARYVCGAAGQADFVAADVLPPRLIKRTDRFTHLAMAAANGALVDAGVTVGVEVAPERAGVMVGNVLGGWEFAERELRKLWVSGARSVSPYQATAWFPAAAQGNICIDHGIKGPARTFVADRASGAYALIHGAQAIVRGQADVVLAGGVEAPLSPYGWLCLETSGFLPKQRNGTDPASLYRPFDARHGGTVFGEGAAIFVLEDLGRARSRGAQIHGELTGWSVTTDGYMPYYTVEPSGAVLARAIRGALEKGGTAAADVGAVFAHGSGIPVEDVTEAYALHEVFGDRPDGVPVTVPKAVFGHLLGAAAPVDAALALRASRAGLIPATANLARPAPGLAIDLVQGEHRAVAPGRPTVVISRGLGGTNACLVLHP
ncbi:beta-ketoacyl-[acyl-carrier-protein] synthase family protein [Streptomyces collinus]|uniref:beta-ketoacyl-[acyl-carrier-protein] synthase family protein n=1 Tax=Streptomyces collinus TaxID=42684 RepID=UPI00380DD7DB